MTQNLYQKAKKGAGTIALAGLAALAGCGGGPTLTIEHDSQSANEYDVIIEHGWAGGRKYPRVIRIGNLKNDDGKFVFVRDAQVYGFNYNPDSEFDEVHINGVFPERYSLEDLASIKEINRIYKEVMSRQNKSQSNTK